MEGADALDSISRSGLYTVIWVEYGICTVVMALRAYSQAFVLRKFAADDIVMLGAYIIQGVASVLCTLSTSYGLGSSVTDLDYHQVVNLLKYAMISMPFGVIAPLLGRISFILFLLTSVITVHKLRRKLLWGLIVLQTIINIVPCILQFTQCDPVEALWNPLQLIARCQGAIVVLRFGYFQGAFNALTDLILILTGLAVIVSLKMRRSNKIVLCIILSLSSLAMIAAILKTVQLRGMNTANFSHAMGLWAIWFLTEGTVVIITASVPRLRAIIVQGRKGNSTYTPYLTPDGSNGPPPYEERSRKHRSIRTTFLETSLDDAPIYPGSEDRRADRGEEGSRDVVLMESGTSLTRSVRVREAL
ncbi:hypothetical protein ASPCAL04760 [Aspergillus calidoustus]|uniref:Rhodopsin domain-containing protein n=1 Tax=Aspergillus calidoustus TaxID=454130 RepID=A0A0U5FZH6_ASPCI|nr:hypothetical protein ASPCAL04760 [Aspergillus calidoustus]